MEVKPNNRLNPDESKKGIFKQELSFDSHADYAKSLLKMWSTFTFLGEQRVFGLVASTAHQIDATSP
jgi:hypothetical protein